MSATAEAGNISADVAAGLTGAAGKGEAGTVTPEIRAATQASSDGIARTYNDGPFGGGTYSDPASNELPPGRQLFDNPPGTGTAGGGVSHGVGSSVARSVGSSAASGQAHADGVARGPEPDSSDVPPEQRTVELSAQSLAMSSARAEATVTPALSSAKPAATFTITRDSSGPVETGSGVQGDAAGPIEGHVGETLHAFDLADAVVIPGPLPASVRVAWDGDRITLAPDPAETDLGDEIVPVFAALRASIERLVAAIDSEPNNIDRRSLNFIRSLLDLVPTQPPDRAGLYQMGFARDDLAALADHVNAEWSADLVARYQGLLRQFDRILDSFRTWREFTGDPAVASMTDDQVEAAAALSADLVSAVSTPQAQPIFDIKIRNALIVFNKQISNTSIGGNRDAVEPAKRRKAFNIVALAQNILGELVKKAFVDGTFKLITAGLLTSPAWGLVISKLVEHFHPLMHWIQPALQALGIG